MSKKSQQIFEEITITDKLDYFLNNFPFARTEDDFNKKVKCIHCDNEFLLNEFKVIRNGYGEEYIVCKHYPECDGSAIDFMRTE